MKVVIMAGGEGMRLRPISANRPKPMVRLYDRPVLEHTLALLKQIGFDEACLTLRYLPQMITDYFGDGSQFGMKLHYKIEEQPLGTAGGVLNCKSFIGDDDTLVISGDCVCDFDLRKLIAFHRERNAEATLALYSHPNPLEYGLVVTDENGRVRHFLEKPAWDRVLTDQINTGIYILSPKTLDKIPQGEPYDFGKDLFPRLLKENAALYGVKMEGYWCDIGSTTAYRTCCIDLLDNEVFLRRLVPTGSGGLWSLTDIPENVTVTPPVYIGRDVTIEENAEIGPCAVIGSGASIRRGAVVRHSVVGHAVIGEGSRLEGAVVLDGAVIGRDAVLEDESVVGDGAAIGDRTRVAAKAKVWTGCDIPPDTTAEGELCRTENLRPLTFDKPGAVTDENGSVLTPHICLTLGEAAAKRGRVGVGWSGGDRARVFAEAFGCGVCAAGGELVRYDGSFLACAAYTAEAYRFDATVYIEEKGGVVTLNMFGPGGTVLTREEERRYEAAARGTQCRATGPYGTATTVTGSVETYIAAASKLASPWVCGERLPVAVTGGGAENRALKRALSLSGFEIGRKAPGIVTLEATEGGLWLTAEDEEGYRLSGERLAVILAHTALERGEKVTLHVPVRNTDRAVGTILGSRITCRYASGGLSEDTITINLTGSAGQSLGAFLPRGVTISLVGDANDYTGKGLSGGKIIVTPPEESVFDPEENIIIGNVALYGATGGEAYIRGAAGERFCVRNSGVKAVVESVGDHGCEYMTGGRVAILGRTGRNFGAGMSGGIAFVYDEDGSFPVRCNTEMVKLLPVDDEYEPELRQMVENHYRYTKSDKAAYLLENWKAEVRRFICVMPNDYAMMLRAIKRAQDDGYTGDEALMMAFNAVCLSGQNGHH